ncbi:metallophosphoesterase [Rubritalea tangerina]|uniref:Metallophosphoesterase n=1 Tax=Rubritalea tangerina TaxID=430798 RepID=A0ABW4Z919_9BACT
MDRRNFIKLSASIGSLTPALTLAEKAQPASAKIAASHPVLMAPREDSISAVWRTTTRAKGYVEYGTAPDKLDQRADGDNWGMRPSGDNHLKVKLHHLTPNTTYYFRAVTETFDRKTPTVEHGEVRSFKTLSSNNPSCHFSIWNDTHKKEETLKTLFEKTPKESEFMLWNGDISNDWYQADDIPNSVLCPAGQSFPFPIIPLRGNHDLRGNYAGDFQDFVSSPEDLPWSAFRVGPVALICLDTGEDKDDDHPYLFGRVSCHDMRVAQAKWLEQIIEQPTFKNAPYRLVCCHIPLRWTDETTDKGYDWFSKRSRILWHDSLTKWGAQAIISGHTHRPALIPATETFPYAQLVGGGPQLDRATLISCIADDKKLHLHSQSLTGETIHSLELQPC